MPLPSATLSGAMSERLNVSARALSAPVRRAMLAFLRNERQPDGGYRGRGEPSDLYYTSFALACLAALDEPDTSPSLRNYLESCLRRTPCTLIDLVCLIRSLALCFPGHASLPRLLNSTEEFRSADGGYSPIAGASHSTAYAPYLVALAYEAGNQPLPEPQRILDALRSLQLPEGGFVNDDSIAAASTPATAAAVLLGRHLSGKNREADLRFLLTRAHASGGFDATAGAPVPDLLSCATALHALRMSQADLSSLRGACLDFVEARWEDCGGFSAHVLDTHPDCEYTFYGLLALGSLLL